MKTVWNETTIAAFITIGAVPRSAEPCFCTGIGVTATGHTNAKQMANAANIITALVAVLSTRDYFMPVSCAMRLAFSWYLVLGTWYYSLGV